MKYKIPLLIENDQVAVVATAKAFDYKQLSIGIQVLKDWGLKVKTGPNIKKKYYQFAGTDEQRLRDFQNLLDDPDIKAIFFARGGYGTSRIIDDIDFTRFKKHPKWLIGFSDLTVVHLLVNRLGYPTIHGPMPLTFLKPGGKKALLELKNMLFNQPGELRVRKHKLNRLGKVSAEITGGNLSIISTMIGTNGDSDFKGKILFLEDIGEYLYHIDRMMVHLKRAGKLKNLAGLIVGQFSDMKDNKPGFGKSVEGIILDAVKENDYPVAFNFPCGHENNNQPIIFEKKAILNITPEGSSLSYSL